MNPSKQKLTFIIGSVILKPSVMEKVKSKPVSAGEVKKKDTALARLLAPLPDDAPLTMAELANRYAPGRPLDRLGACAIILAYLRADKKKNGN